MSGQHLTVESEHQAQKKATLWLLRVLTGLGVFAALIIAVGADAMVVCSVLGALLGFALIIVARRAEDLAAEVDRLKASGARAVVFAENSPRERGRHARR